MLRGSRWWRAALAGAAVVLVAAVALAGPAAAAPATTVGYPAWASATRYSGLAFDACTAPSIADIEAWMSSPYRAIGIYVGGQNRTCAQPELNSGWVGAVAMLGWRLIPIFKGRQRAMRRQAGRPEDRPGGSGARGHLGG